ncbi:MULTISPECIES: YbjN domain-containing protein [Paraburkholderia]|uniref:YbjN domain-containing protein n=1 Tax=Paraburkholderia podalyriae TaxID=1938811 RepID=A0ABR7PWZ6_9BURK|nr:YbjN domain-containing protein [Paraburkholderia podalyriae]MBC8750772.1 YbjN domain-containing protein [Paraburkholderia podalyriae]
MTNEERDAIGTAAMNQTAEAVIEAVSVEQLGDIFKTAGYRVTAAEQNGLVQLMSASQGVGFAVRFGNRSAEDGQYLDYTLSCALQVQGELPAEIVSGWNRTKRFTRLWVQAQFLVLEMDVVVGGVTERHLRSTIELWDRLIQEFLLHLRNRPAMAAVEAQGASQSGEAAGTGESGLKATLQ